MRTSILVLMAISVVGCASRQTKWERIIPGQSQDEVTDVMGNPDSIQVKDGNYVYGWGMNAYSACWATFDAGKVREKSCSVDQNAANRYQAVQMQAMQNIYNQNLQTQQFQQQNLQNYQNTLMQQRRTPAQTNCTSSKVGGQVYTNCSGY